MQRAFRVARVPIGLERGGFLYVASQPMHSYRLAWKTSPSRGQYVQAMGGAAADPPFPIGVVRRPCGQDEVGKSIPIGLLTLDNAFTKNRR